MTCAPRITTEDLLHMGQHVERNLEGDLMVPKNSTIYSIGYLDGSCITMHAIIST